MSEVYVYYENNWNDPFLGYKRNNDNLMWRYWAAREMAIDIVNKDTPHPRLMDNGVIYFHKDMEWRAMVRSNLAQILKKEWFR